MTMDIPPLFKPSIPACVRTSFFVLIALIMLIIDFRTHVLIVVRNALSITLYPFQMVALIPRDAVYKISDYMRSFTALQKENRILRQQQIFNAQLLQQEQQLSAENARLRNLLNMQKRIKNPSILAEILHDARDPFTRKIIINRGSQHGVVRGQPVIDNIGIVGQITHVFPLTAEVTLLTDKNQAIPVQILRNGLRSVAYGHGGYSGILDLRFISVNADIKKGDVLVTSGIDNLYPGGLFVGTVLEITIKSSDMFAHISCLPLAGIDRYKQLLILKNTLFLSN